MASSKRKGRAFLPIMLLAVAAFALGSLSGYTLAANGAPNPGHYWNEMECSDDLCVTDTEITTTSVIGTTGGVEFPDGRVQTEANFWKTNPDDPSDIYNTNFGGVGIGSFVPDGFSFAVSGDMQVDDIYLTDIHAYVGEGIPGGMYGWCREYLGNCEAKSPSKCGGLPVGCKCDTGYESVRTGSWSSGGTLSLFYSCYKT